MRIKIQHFLKWLTLLPIAGLCGCAGMALRHDYQDYSEVYADSINRQILLNLARLSQNEPAYFIQLGTISSQYQFTTSAGIAPSHTGISHNSGVAAAVVQNSLTLGGTLGAGVTETPIFQFVPLNGDSYAQAITTPLSTKVFYTLYDQGDHADILMRTMVGSVEETFTETNGTTVKTNHQFYINSAKDRTYADFLELCVKLRAAQLEHTLVVNTNTTTNRSSYAGVKLSEAVSAIQAGMEITNNSCDTSNYFVTRTSPGLFLEEIDIAAPNASKYNYQPQSLEHIELAPDFARLYKAHHFQFKMRTFEAIMYSVAKEQGYFDTLAAANTSENSHIHYYKDCYGTIAVVTYTNYTNSFRPIINACFEPKARTDLSELTTVHYKTNTYTIGDLKQDKEKEYKHITEVRIQAPFPSTDNRTVFTLISYLFSQFAIDPQKLPVQQLIQVQ